MTAPVSPVSGSEAPATGIIPPVSPPSTIAEAASRARELIAQGKMGPTDSLPPAEPLPAEIPVEGAAPVVEPVVEGEVGGDAPAGELNELVVEIPGRNSDDEPFVLEAGDKEAADRLRQLVNGYARGEQARAIRDEAQQLREQAEDLQYAMQLDPAGYVTSTIQDPNDLHHLFRYLATRPGILESSTDWLAEMMGDPGQIQREARDLDAMRIQRRDQMMGQVNARREIDQNARQIVRTATKTIESLAPSGWDDEARGIFTEDVLNDVRRYARTNNLNTVDPRAVPGLVQHRLKLMGLAPRNSANTPQGGTPTPTGNKGPVAGQAPSPAQLQQQSARRHSAASAPPGAGSPVAAIPKAPAYDPKAPGSPVQQAANYARTMIRRFQQRPS